jgi:hypothetical protein
MLWQRKLLLLVRASMALQTPHTSKKAMAVTRDEGDVGRHPGFHNDVG